MNLRRWFNDLDLEGRFLPVRDVPISIAKRGVIYPSMDVLITLIYQTCQRNITKRLEMLIPCDTYMTVIR